MFCIHCCFSASPPATLLDTTVTVAFETKWWWNVEWMQTYFKAILICANTKDLDTISLICYCFVLNCYKRIDFLCSLVDHFSEHHKTKWIGQETETVIEIEIGIETEEEIARLIGRAILDEDQEAETDDVEAVLQRRSNKDSVKFWSLKWPRRT